MQGLAGSVTRAVTHRDCSLQLLALLRSVCYRPGARQNWQSHEQVVPSTALANLTCRALYGPNQ